MQIPVKRFDHVSFTVSDIERSTTFFARFGWEKEKDYRSEGPDVDDGTDTERADMDIRWLTHPLGGPRLEMLRYLHHGDGPAAHNSKVGAAHLCFVVDDVMGAYEDLKADGITFLSAPHTDAFGCTWVYMRDPDGNAFELYQDPVA